VNKSKSKINRELREKREFSYDRVIANLKIMSSSLGCNKHYRNFAGKYSNL